MEKLVDRSLTAALVTGHHQDALPQRARVVIVGGGIVGASVAAHLAAEGERDVLVLEANRFGSGTSWHAAGLVTGARATGTLTKLAGYGLAVYEGLAERTGVDVNFARSGSVSIARTPGRVDEITYARDVARQHDVETELLTEQRFLQLWPLASWDGVLTALHFPGDGSVNPGYAAIAFAKLAADGGVALREDVRILNVLTAGNRVTGVRTSQGDVEAEVVVLAGGLWTRDLAATAGAHVPLYAAEHMHVRTNPIAGVGPSFPVLRDLDRSYYIRHELGRLLVGAFEPNGIPRAATGIPDGGFAEFPANWDHFAPVRGHAERTVPAIAEAGFDRFLNAPESFTPDASFALGETNEAEGLFVAAGMNSQGIIFAPAVGRELAAWILSGVPQFDASSVDVRRFARVQSNARFLHDRTREGLGRLYAMHWPQLQMTAGRNVRRSPLHPRLAELGASFGELNGWERANWFEEPGTAPVREYSYRRPGWFGHVAGEHRAARQGVVVFDLSSFAKFEVAGPEALPVLERTFTAGLDGPIGKAVYTLALNTAGGIELDGTVTRLAADRFLVVTPAAAQDKTLSILRRAAAGHAAAVFDATAAMATIAVMGPRSRELMQRVSPADWSDEAQPYTCGRTVEVADGYAFTLRVSFVGELGYELYPTADLALNVFDALWTAGQDLGLRLAGYFALDSLRSEKGFRHLGHDIGPADDPTSAGLRFTLGRNKPGGFTGQEPALAVDPENPPHRTVYVAVDDPEPLLLHDETIFCDSKPAGRCTSGSYGHTLGRAVGIAAIDPSAPLDAHFTIECRGQRYPLTVSRRPFYDPTGARMKG